MGNVTSQADLYSAEDREVDVAIVMLSFCALVCAWKLIRPRRAGDREEFPPIDPTPHVTIDLSDIQPLSPLQLANGPDEEADITDAFELHNLGSEGPFYNVRLDKRTPRPTSTSSVESILRGRLYTAEI